MTIPAKTLEQHIAVLGKTGSADGKRAGLPNDPKLLRTKIADLERKLDKSASAVQTSPAAIELAREQGRAAGIGEGQRMLQPLIEEPSRGTVRASENLF